MDTKETDRLINDYLRQLDRAAAHMQQDRRAELLAEIREHIDAALRQDEAAGEAAVRNVLDRLVLLPIVLVGLSFALGGPHGAEESLPSGDARPAGEKVEAPLELGAAAPVLIAAGVPSALYLGWQSLVADGPT